MIPLLVLPTGQKIRFEETSRDVIHSFWVPELLFKRDVFPGNVRNLFEVSLDKEGRYVGRCAELCGTYHAFMKFELVVVSPEQFDEFLAAKQAGKSTQEAMGAIGYTGDEQFAVTTQPFDTPAQRRQLEPGRHGRGQVEEPDVKTEYKIFLGVAAFLFGTAIVYGVWTHGADRPASSGSAPSR